MGDRTIQAAIHAVHMEIPKFISRDSEKDRSELGAANNLRWILDTLVHCFDNKKRPPGALLYSLRGLSYVADLLEQAAKLNVDAPDECTHHRYKKLRKEAEDALLDCFGLLSKKGAPSCDQNKIISMMARFLCPPVNDELEPIGESSCRSIKAAAKKTESELGISYRTADRAWKDYETLFQYIE